MRLLLASGNPKKVREIAAILGGAAGAEGQLLTLAEFPGLPPVVEDGATFLENARKKARAGAAATGLPTLGEDSGLEVEALGGAPGVYSARYAGEGGGDEANWRKLLREMEGVPAGRRGARFVCTAVLVLPGGGEEEAVGSVEGEIALAPRGEGGFGYDPVFLLPDGRTMAELSPGQKEAVSHRGKALRALAPKLQALLAAD